MRAGDFNIVAKDPVITNLEGRDPGALFFFLLQSCNPTFALTADTAQLIELVMVAFADQATFTHHKGRIIDDSLRNQLNHFRQSIKAVSQLRQQRALYLRETINKLRKFFQ